MESVLQEELQFIKDEKLQQRPLTDKEPLKPFLKGEKNIIDESRHFSYFAFDGEIGDEKWKHEGEDFHKDLAGLKEELLPQRYYKLDAESLSASHFGEVSCQDYRESILNSLPHFWEKRSDTKLKLAHFEKHKTGKGQNKKQLAEKSNLSLNLYLLFSC